MRCEILYQCELTFDRPKGIPAQCTPVWSWPVPLPDGRTILTLLYEFLETGGTGKRTVILELSAQGAARKWPPAEGYPAPVIAYATPGGDLVGLDLVRTGKLYACRVDGEHRWTIEAEVRMDYPIAPQSLVEAGGKLHWTGADGKHRFVDVSTGVPADVRQSAEEEALPKKGEEVHFPHTHIMKGLMYVLDFDSTDHMSVSKICE